MRLLSIGEGCFLLLLLPSTWAFAPLHSGIHATNHVPYYREFSMPLFASIAPESESTTPLPTPTVSELTSTQKFRKLKDLMWVRETLEDMTAAEFACSIDASLDSSNKRRRKRAIDYENLLHQLDNRILDLACDDKASCQVSAADPFLTPGEGMGAIVYSETQRNDLLKRIVKIRGMLLETMKGHVDDEEEEGFSIPLPELKIPKEDDPSALGPKLYVRDDGTVDWDGALQDRAALRNFGTAVWARINGQNPENVNEEALENGVEEHHAPTPVTAKIEETDAIREKKLILDVSKKELADMETKHTALLNSALKAGQVVANINFATLDPALRKEIRKSDEGLERKREEVSYQTLNYELERIFTYLSGELGNPSSKGYIPLQDRLNVAEFGLLEAQVEGFNRMREAGEIVDEDVLAVVSEQVTDFKRRLGIDYYVTGVTFDAEAIQRWLVDLVAQAGRGLGFYVKGCKLFWNDIVFCVTLIGRALQGYTLKPREVRNLRRTFKDLLTFIPVVIILLIPLTPVGHVMVFGAIQRFFPDFFPSVFTERRQNLLSLYESTEYTEVTIEENWNEKLARLFSALSFVITSAYVQIVAMITGSMEDEGEETGVNGKVPRPNGNESSVNGDVNGNVESRVNGKTEDKVNGKGPFGF